MMVLRLWGIGGPIVWLHGWNDGFARHYYLVSPLIGTGPIIVLPLSGTPQSVVHLIRRYGKRC